VTQALLNIGDFVGYIEPPVKAVPIPNVWYMLRMHPNYDLKAERQFNERGVSVYVPKETQKVKGVWNRYRWRKVPIFPGIVFVPDFEANLQRLKQIADGIGGFIRHEGAALQVSLRWMDKIRDFEAKVQELPSRGALSLGQKVRIVGGPWDLWEGKVSRLDPKDRITVLIEAVIGEVPVELDASQVEVVQPTGKGSQSPRSDNARPNRISGTAKGHRLAR